jgi:lysophospholipase L1-like esterase/DNA-binding XRE family transcriptional regulator
VTPDELQAARAALGVSQKKLAELLGVAQSAVSRWEAGQQRIAHPTMLRLALERLRDARPLLALALGALVLAWLLGAPPAHAAPAHRLYLPLGAQVGGAPVVPVLDAATAAAVRGLAAANPGGADRVLLVGDSITVDPRFLPGVDPERPAAFGGFTARDLFRSEPRCRPSLLPCELAATRPGIALVMVGTNDLRLGADPTDMTGLRAVVEACLAAGAVPVLSTIPPYPRDPAIGARVPTYNAAVARLAAEARVPLWNYALALETSGLADRGVGADGVHPSADGYRVRTQTALAVLAAVRSVMADEHAHAGALP